MSSVALVPMTNELTSIVQTLSVVRVTASIPAATDAASLARAIREGVVDGLADVYEWIVRGLRAEVSVSNLRALARALNAPPFIRPRPRRQRPLSPLAATGTASPSRVASRRVAPSWKPAPRDAMGTTTGASLADRG